MRETGAGARAVDLLFELVAISSVTGSERALLDFLETRFREGGWTVQTMEVTPDGRRNLFVHGGRPRVVLTSHADTVPPFFEPRRQGGLLFARGACDAKASLASQAVAFEQLAAETEGIGFLVLVGEEKGSDGALAANRQPPPAARYLVGGEPTGNQFVTASQGCLRVAIETRGVAGHSSLPESGKSAVEPLLDLLADLRTRQMPPHPLYGKTTMNIGLLEAGAAPNVIAENARAEIVFRTGEPSERLLTRIEKLAEGRAEISLAYRSDPISLRSPRGSPVKVVSFACDLPLLSAWGEPVLVGPGSIAYAHTSEERVELSEVERAVFLYIELAQGLLSKGEEYLEPRAPLA